MATNLDVGPHVSCCPRRAAFPRESMIRLSLTRSGAPSRGALRTASATLAAGIHKHRPLNSTDEQLRRTVPRGIASSR
jgi:hypothetical protein